MTAVPRHVYDSRGGVTRYKTQMALVRLDPGAGFGISMTSSGLQITATVAWAQISYVPTPVVNDWIDGVNERYAYLEDAQLEKHHYAEIRPRQAVTELPVEAALAPRPAAEAGPRAASSGLAAEAPLRPRNVGARVHALCIGSIAERRWPDVGRDTMTAVCWANPVRQRQDGTWAETGQTQPTKLHVTGMAYRPCAGSPFRTMRALSM
jgi:hypothetical protein